MDSSQAKPTAEQVKGWDSKTLLDWIKTNRPKLLSDDQLEKFEQQDISGDVFLNHAGEWEFFKNSCGLPTGPSDRLANLATELAGGETSVVKGKLPSFILCTPRRLQADRLRNLVVVFILIHIIAAEHTAKRKRPPDTDIAPPPKRTKVGDSSLRINGPLKHLRSGSMSFSTLLRKEGQAYFDRTRYISVLHELDTSILFCRPRRFGKSLTVSMLEHFHGLQYTEEHQSLYQVCDNILNYLDVRTYFSFNRSRISMCKKISTQEK